ncbi:MAG TPA: FCD domain-containing protein [Myxococcota bacterium]|nr:FCD domain-containing protein [Myxococcota bacterium]
MANVETERAAVRHPRAGSPVRVPKTAELVANRLRRQIVRGQLKEGDSLPPEAELVTSFGVSRPTLREAFRILESESLISVTRGSRGGARVHLPDLRTAARRAGILLQVRGVTLADVQEARMILEPPCARLLAEQRDRDALRQLRAVIEQERVQLDDPHAFAELSTRFHELIVELGGNQTLSLLVSLLHDIVEMHAEASLESAREKGDESALARRRRAIRSHEKLVELVEAGEGERAERHWRNHMDVASRLILNSVGAKTVVDLLE